MASEGRVGTRTRQFGIGGEKSGSTVESLDKWIKDLLISGEWSIGMLHGMTYGYDAFSDSEILWEHFRRVKNRKTKYGSIHLRKCQPIQRLGTTYNWMSQNTNRIFKLLLD